jgi:formamidopyrimidine-DNA glycosylase
MPELPEVETVVRGLRAPLVGRTITEVWYERPEVIRAPTPAVFAAWITGQTVRAIQRRAKYIVCELQSAVFVVHLKMTGRLYVAAPAQTHSDDRWIRLRLALDNGHTLHFSDARRFGRVWLVEDMAQVAPDLGPEPLAQTFTPQLLADRLRGRSKAIKALLLDQSFVAGVGNIYADESLHIAGIHPLCPANRLNDTDIARLHSAIRVALSGGIDHEGASINWYRKPDGTPGASQDHFRVYGRTGQPCPVCGAPIAKIRVAQRGTHFCPTCQPER